MDLFVMVNHTLHREGEREKNAERCSTFKTGPTSIWSHRHPVLHPYTFLKFAKDIKHLPISCFYFSYNRWVNYINRSCFLSKS